MIRKIRAEDRDEYFEMSRKFYASGAAHTEISDRMREKFWNEILRGELISGYIIECENETAGYALVFYYASQEFGGRAAFVDEVFVKEEYRGRGLAKEFFAFAENADGTVITRLEAERGNARAISLYRSLGYEILDYVQMIKKR